MNRIQMELRIKSTSNDSNIKYHPFIDTKITSTEYYVYVFVCEFKSFLQMNFYFSLFTSFNCLFWIFFRWQFFPVWVWKDMMHLNHIRNIFYIVDRKTLILLAPFYTLPLVSIIITVFPFSPFLLCRIQEYNTCEWIIIWLRSNLCFYFLMFEQYELKTWV